MSNPQPITQAYQPGRTVVALIYDMANSLIWNTSSLSWDAITSYNPASPTNYITTLTDAQGIGWYSAALPTQILGMTVQIVTYDSGNGMTNPIGGGQMAAPDTGAPATPITSLVIPGSAPIQPITQAYQPGRSVVALIYDMANSVVWNTVRLAFETFDPANQAEYQTALTDALGIGWYSAPFPTALLGMTVQVVTYDSENLTQPIGGGEMNPPDTGALAAPATSPAIVAVINKGLMFLGVAPITSLLDDSEAAQKASAIYGSVLDATLRSHYWKFATYVAPLAELSLPDFDSVNSPGYPVPGWEHMYVYPKECVMLRRIFDSTWCDPSIAGLGFTSYTFDYGFTQHYDLYKDILYRYKVMLTPTTMQKAIAAHITPAYVEYTYRVTDPELWDMYFSDAMSWNLAAQLARTLTGNTELGTQALQMFVNVVSEAKRLDAQEDKTKRETMSTYQRVRM